MNYEKDKVKRLTIRMNTKQYEAILSEAKKKNLTASEYLRDVLKSTEKKAYEH